MDFLKIVDIKEDGTCEENVSSICYHPVQIENLLAGKNVKPQFCAVDIFDEDDIEKMKELRNELLNAADKINKKIYGK
jgi:hypothetical protein